SARIYEAYVNGIHIYIAEQPELFSNPDIYPEKLDAVSALPFIFLSFAAFELPVVTNWKPQFLHAHDWPAAALPSALRWHRYYSSFNAEYDTLFTVHNLAHQGIFDQSAMEGWGFAPEAYSSLNTNSMEFYGQLNLMKGAVIASEAVTTVSPSYSWDIQTVSGGFGLDGVVASYKNKLTGILNGIDYDVWNPETDKILPAPYSASDTSGKKICRAALLDLCGWKEDGLPVVVFVGRLAEQKGIDIMLDGLASLLPENFRAVIIGSGTDLYNRKLREFADSFPGSVHAVLEFSEKSAHIAYAGGDILVMPSLFEPCGLSQLIAFKYGTIPVARATGGLADTVMDADSSSDGTGFLFTEYSAEEFTNALLRALSAKKDVLRWSRIMSNAMQRDFSWDASAKVYAELYGKIITSD
ncbi:MAG: glycogen/starch synthase, partial [Synergistaceae bacterium]